MKLRTHYAHTIATTSPQPPRNLGTISPPSRPRPASEIRARLEGGCGRAAATASTPGAGAPWRQLLSAATAATVRVHCTHVFILSMPCGDECLMCVGDRRRSYRGVERHVSLRAYRVIFPLARGVERIAIGVARAWGVQHGACAVLCACPGSSMQCSNPDSRLDVRMWIVVCKVIKD